MKSIVILFLNLNLQIFKKLILILFEQIYTILTISVLNIKKKKIFLNKRKYLLNNYYYI